MEIQARHLTNTFGNFTAVRDLNIRVPRDTIFAFLGPNGSSKSTTAELLTGLLAPIAGEALVAGELVTIENIALKRRLGIRPEENGFFTA